MTITQKTATALLAVLSLSLPGCSLVGLTIGSQFKKMDTRAPAPQNAQYGDTVEVVFDDSMGTHVTTGTYGGTLRGELFVESDEGTVRVPLAQARTLRVKRGTYWLEGMIPGLVVDVVVLTAVSISAAKSAFNKPIDLHLQ
jgi:hypothetical protein